MITASEKKKKNTKTNFCPILHIYLLLSGNFRELARNPLASAGWLPAWREGSVVVEGRGPSDICGAVEDTHTYS